MALVLAGHPFDTIKVRLQTEGKSGRFTGPLNCLSQTVRKEGVRALYKGVTPPLLATGVINSVLFGLQGLTIHNVQRVRGHLGQTATIGEIAGSAVITGALISVLVTPMEGIKARLQVLFSLLTIGPCNHSLVNFPHATSPSPYCRSSIMQWGMAKRNSQDLSTAQRRSIRNLVCVEESIEDGSRPHCAVCPITATLGPTST